jgi:hypothetical protein
LPLFEIEASSGAFCAVHRARPDRAHPDPSARGRIPFLNPAFAQQGAGAAVPGRGARPIDGEWRAGIARFLCEQSSRRQEKLASGKDDSSESGKSLHARRDAVGATSNCFRSNINADRAKTASSLDKPFCRLHYSD